MSQTAQMRPDRLEMLVGLRDQWRGQVAEVRYMREWVIQTEHILAGQWASAGEAITNETVGRRLDAWCQQLTQQDHVTALSPNPMRLPQLFFESHHRPETASHPVLRRARLSSHQQ